MAAVISSTSMLNVLHICYPSISMFNNSTDMFLVNKKTLMPIISFSCVNKKTSTTTLQVSNIKEKSKYNNINIVCSSSSSSPWLMLPSKEAKNNETDDDISQVVHTLYGRCFYDIRDKTFVPALRKQPSSDDYRDVKCIGASHGWLAFVDRRDCALFLCNPRTAQTIELPPIETLSAFRGVCYRKLNDSSFKIAGLTTEFKREELIMSLKEVVNYIVEKIILTSSPLEKDCVVVLSFNFSLAYCKIGDDKWTNLYGHIQHGDAVYRSKDNKIYTKTSQSYSKEFTKLAIWDVSDASSPQITYQKFCNEEVNKICDRHEDMAPYHEYLVEYSPPPSSSSPSSSSGGKLLLVSRFFVWDHVERSEDSYTLLMLKKFYGVGRKIPADEIYPFRTVRFEVFEFDEEKKKLVEVRDLGEMALFVGINHSMAVDAGELPGLIPNAVYFGDTYGDRVVQEEFEAGKIPWIVGDDFGIYSMGDESVISPCYSTRPSKYHVIYPHPFGLYLRDVRSS